MQHQLTDSDKQGAYKTKQFSTTFQDQIGAFPGPLMSNFHDLPWLLEWISNESDFHKKQLPIKAEIHLVTFTTQQIEPTLDSLK